MNVLQKNTVRNEPIIPTGICIIKESTFTTFPAFSKYLQRNLQKKK